MHPKSVTADRGWRWLTDGARLFARKPIGWTLLIVSLFLIIKVASFVPFLGLIMFLLMPVFLAGLMGACKITEEGRPLHVRHLFSGFQRNAGPLVAIGGISLIGNLALGFLVVTYVGDSLPALAKIISSNQTITPEIALQMQAVATKMFAALSIGLMLSLPLLMALWFAPLLIYLDDVKPLQSLKASFMACLKNSLPMLVYGIVIFVALLMVMPIGVVLRQYDLPFWLIAPVVVPSIYTSYKDIFTTPAGAPAADGGPFPR